MKRYTAGIGIVCLLVVFVFISPVFASFRLMGTLVGGVSAKKTLYINQGEKNDISFIWDKNSKFMSSDGSKLSSSQFLQTYKNKYVGIECVETNDKLLIIMIVELRNDR